jgi:2-dehydro-3-deoxygalactonokinase
MSDRFIALDWGTSSFRAYLVDQNGEIIAERSGPDGILTVTDGDFEPVLERHIDDWDEALPILASGMITSKQGWIEVPYCACPAGLREVANALRHHTTSESRAIAFVPGLTCVNDGVPDVMRGEETQIFGSLDGASGQFVLPGTHSKWASVKKGRIETFRTYMTGEIFAAATGHTILGRLMEEGDHDRQAFAHGVNQGLVQGKRLLHALFSARTLALFGEVKPESVESYLSGLLIGAEIGSEPKRGTVTLVGSPALCARYSEAFAVAGRDTVIGNPQAAVLGLQRVGRATRLIT